MDPKIDKEGKESGRWKQSKDKWWFCVMVAVLLAPRFKALSL